MLVVRNLDFCAMFRQLPRVISELINTKVILKHAPTSLRCSASSFSSRAWLPPRAPPCRRVVVTGTTPPLPMCFPRKACVRAADQDVPGWRLRLVVVSRSTFGKSVSAFRPHRHVFFREKNQIMACGTNSSQNWPNIRYLKKYDVHT